MLTDYSIQYREAGSNLPFTEVYVGSNTTVFHLTGLKPLYSYEVRVAAKTSAGRGPFSSIVTSYLLMATPITYTIIISLLPLPSLLPTLTLPPSSFHLPSLIVHLPFLLFSPSLSPPLSSLLLLLLPPSLPSLLPFLPP